MFMLERAREAQKKAGYAAAFLRGRVVHTNLQILYDCMFRCRICDFWKDEHKRAPRLSAAQVAVISDKLAQIGPQIVSIGGGEPLMHPEIEAIVRALGRHHFPVMICNGWLVTPERARALWDAGMYEISVSVDYVDPARHDEQRATPGAHARALEALRVLHQTRTRPWQRVHMISVIMDDNVADVEALIQRCREIGITYLLTLYSDSRGSKPRLPVPLDVSRHLLALKERYPEFVALRGYLARFSQAIAEGGIGPCSAGKRLLNIDSEGSVSTCIDRIEDKVGNLLVDDMLVLERRLREKHQANTCKSCWTSCRGNIESIATPDLRHSLGNAWDYWQMAKDVPLGKRFA
jgi:MoaA/NifB/PqqE/SkfB family radical SAM enzyme